MALPVENTTLSNSSVADLNTTSWLGTTMPLSMTMTTPSHSTLSPPKGKEMYKIALITIYMVVLVVGSVGMLLMIRVLRANLRSWTTIAILNLIFAHFIFLLTVPFRIYYYATGGWSLSTLFCKVVSAMIHIHMYIVFFIYVIILTVHFLHYYKKMEQIEFHRKIHAVGASIGMWSSLIIIVPIILHLYGKSKDMSKAADNASKCFHFERELKNDATFVINVLLSVATLFVSIALSCVLAVIMHSVVKKHGSALRVHQEFWAQMKNVSLMLIILVFLVPYHLFRLYYLKKTSDLKDVNELFLAVTTLTCFDMLLLFTGKGICQRCGVC